MSKSQRDKGARLEREAAKLLEAVYPKSHRSAAQAHGALEPDILGTDWWVEVSGGKAPSPHSKYAQAERDVRAAADDRPILVLTKRDRGPWLATMWIGDLLDLANARNAAHEAGRAAGEVDGWNRALTALAQWAESRCHGCGVRLRHEWAGTLPLDGPDWPRGGTRADAPDADSRDE